MQCYSSHHPKRDIFVGAALHGRSFFRITTCDMPASSKMAPSCTYPSRLYACRKLRAENNFLYTVAGGRDSGEAPSTLSRSHFSVMMLVLPFCRSWPCAHGA